MAWGNRWEWEHTRKSTAGPLNLDVRALKRAGALNPGTVSTVGWGQGQSIITRMDRHGHQLTLDYRTRRRDTDPSAHGARVARDDPVPLRG